MTPDVGTLALLGQTTGERPGPGEARLLNVDGAPVLHVLPTGAAYERPQLLLERLRRRYEPAGVRVEAVPVLTRRDAEEPGYARAVGEARLVLLAGSSALHLRSVLKDSSVLAALVGAWHGGATVLGSSAGAAVLSDPMVDPRGGAFTVGLGLVRRVAIVADGGDEQTASFRRTLALAPMGCPILALGPGSVVVRSSDGVWRDEGDASSVYLDGQPSGLDALAGKPVW